MIKGRTWALHFLKPENQDSLIFLIPVVQPTYINIPLSWKWESHFLIQGFLKQYWRCIHHILYNKHIHSPFAYITEATPHSAQATEVIAADLEAFDPEYFSNLKWMLDNVRLPMGFLRSEGMGWSASSLECWQVAFVCPKEQFVSHSKVLWMRYDVVHASFFVLRNKEFARLLRTSPTSWSSTSVQKVMNWGKWRPERVRDGWLVKPRCIVCYWSLSST